MNDEDFVRAHWDLGKWEPRRGHDGRYGIAGVPNSGRCDDLSDAWLCARAFTEQRLEEIRQVEREIELIAENVDGRAHRIRYGGEAWPIATRLQATFARILAREQQALADLKRGMIDDHASMRELARASDRIGGQ